MGKNFQQLFPPVVIQVLQPAFHLAHGIFLLFGSFGINQIGQAFCLGQIHFSIIKSTFGKFARFSHTKTFYLRQSRKDSGNYGLGAVSLNFNNIFPGKRIRCLKIQNKAFVQRIAFIVFQADKISIAWFYFCCIQTCHFFQCRKSIVSGNTDDGNA